MMHTDAPRVRPYYIIYLHYYIPMNKKHFISLLSYLGVWFIGGSISHGFFTGTRSAIMAGIWLFLFLLWELLSKDAERSRWQTIFYGLLYSLSIGMISWGFTHFLDSPERSLWILPTWYFVSRLVFAAKNKWEGFNRLSILWGLFTTAALFWLARAAILYLPASFYSELADHHHEWIEKQPNTWNNNSNTKYLSWTQNDNMTFKINRKDNNWFFAWKSSSVIMELSTIIWWENVMVIDDLDLVHEKYVHLILVRNDGGDFLHLHPERVGYYRRTPVTFPSAWKRTMYADFKSRNYGAQIIKDEIIVEWSTNNFIINPINSTGTVITQSGIDFTITRDTPSIINATNFYVRASSGILENYLGAKGHMVAINLADMGYSHVHPNENNPQDSFRNVSDANSTSFMAHLEKSGIYRIFIQVQIAGEIYTLPLSINVKEDISWSNSIAEHNHH